MTSSNPVDSTKDSINVKSQDSEKGSEDNRLWIGNLDSKLTEFQLLKLIQRFGPIDNFDFLFHRTGPNAGLPRGYAFVTFKTADGAENCLEKLNGKKIFDRTVCVRWAQQTQFNNDEEEKLRQKLPALGMTVQTSVEPKISKERTISAIEAKLKAMEREKEGNSNFSLTQPGGNSSAASSSKAQNVVVHNYQYPYASSSSSKPTYRPHTHDSHRIRSRPYSNRGRKRY